jgi:hypothetical protein
MRNTLYRIKQKIISSLKKPINYKAIFENGFESFKKTAKLMVSFSKTCIKKSFQENHLIQLISH